MRKLIAFACLALSLVGCASNPSTIVIESNPPWCKDYVLTDPVTGKRFLRYNSPQGNFVRGIDDAEIGSIK